AAQVVGDLVARLDEALALQVVRGDLDGGERAAPGRFGPVREQVHAGDLSEQLEVSARVLLEEAAHLDEPLAAHHRHLVAAVARRRDDGVRMRLPEEVDQGLSHLPRNLFFLSPSSSSGAFSTVWSWWRCAWIFSWRILSPSSTCSGRGGHP